MWNDLKLYHSFIFGKRKNNAAFGRKNTFLNRSSDKSTDINISIAFMLTPEHPRKIHERRVLVHPNILSSLVIRFWFNSMYCLRCWSFLFTLFSDFPSFFHLFKHIFSLRVFRFLQWSFSNRGDLNTVFITWLQRASSW